ncbi:MAG: GAF domain-containing protein, partial [Caldilineaceae bacterium]|nr:GAF domain-containing protein [Caldilineaceae bacterium]
MAKVLIAMHSTAVTVQLIEPEARSFVLLSQSGLPTSLVADLDGIAADHGLPGRVLADEKPVLCHDLATDKWGATVTGATGLRTYLGAPMRTGGKTTGVLSMYSDGLYAYQTEDIALLTSIADQLAIIVHNSQLWALTQQRLRQLNLLYEVGSALHSHLQLDQVLQT